MTAIMICAVMLAGLLANLWFGLARGRVLGRGGMVTRDGAPFRFWGAVGFSGVGAALFDAVLLALFGFQPALRALHVVPCNGQLAGCIEQEPRR